MVRGTRKRNHCNFFSSYNALYLLKMLQLLVLLNITETCKNHCFKILHCTWQLKCKITNCDQTLYSCSQSEKKRFSLFCFCISHQQQMHATSMHKTFYRHLKPPAVRGDSLPWPPTCSWAETTRPARPPPAPSCQQAAAPLQRVSRGFGDATGLQQWKLLRVCFECNRSA